MPNRLKIGLAGLGKMGSLHLTKLLELPDVFVCGVYDTDLSRVNEVESQYGISRFPSIASLISECDVMWIATPTETHFEIAQESLRQKKHTFIEKPACESSHQLKVLLELATENHCWFQIGFLEMYRYQALKVGSQIPDIHALPWSVIEIVRQGPPPPWVLPGLRMAPSDVVLDLMVHDIDWLSAIFGAPLSLEYSLIREVRSSIIDFSEICLRLPQGSLALLRASWLRESPERKVVLSSPQQSLELDWCRNRVAFFDSSGPPGSEKKVFESGPIDALKLQAAGFVQTVLNHSPREHALAEASLYPRYLKTMELIERIRKYSRG